MKVIIVTGLFCFFIIKIKFLKDNSIFKTQELVLMNNDKRDNFTNASPLATAVPKLEKNPPMALKNPDTAEAIEFSFCFAI